jgi:hypothetical protein
VVKASIDHCKPTVMNLKNFTWRTLILLLTCTYLTSCQKDTDPLQDPGGQDGNAPNKTAAREKLTVKKVRIQKIIQHDLPFYYVPTRTGIFEYNKWGDPVRILFDFNSTGDKTTNWLFKYNQKHQLTDAIKSYTNSYFDWYKFVYDHKGTIIRDTTQYFGQMLGEIPQPGLDTSINYYSYDSQDRITKIHQVFYNISYDYFYNYDSNGNLIRTGYTPQGQSIPLVYDDQINPQRTDEVFMFVARDYSRNNATTAESYNNRGLPLVFRQQYTTALFLGADIANADILYEE